MIKSTTIEVKSGKDALVRKTEVVPYRICLRQTDGNVRIQLLYPHSSELIVPAEFLEQNSFTVNIEYTLSCQYVTVDALRQLIESAHRNIIESSTEWRYRSM